MKSLVVLRVFECTRTHGTHIQQICCGCVRERGLEPLRPWTPEPKSGASANFATRAWWYDRPNSTGLDRYREALGGRGVLVSNSTWDYNDLITVNMRGAHVSYVSVTGWTRGFKHEGEACFWMFLYGRAQILDGSATVYGKREDFLMILCHPRPCQAMRLRNACAPKGAACPRRVCRQRRKSKRLDDQ